MEIFSVDLNSTDDGISQASEVERSWSPRVCFISSRLLSPAILKKKEDKNPWLAAGIAANVLGWIVQTDAPEAATVNGVLKSTGGLLSRDRRSHNLVFIKQDRDVIANCQTGNVVTELTQGFIDEWPLKTHL